MKLALHTLPRLGVLALALGLSLSACVSSSGIASKISPRALSASVGENAKADAAFPTERWWTALGDPALDKLLDTALRDSPTLAIADARLHRAQIVIDAADAAYGPTVVANVNPTAQRFSENYIYPKPLAGSVRTLNRAALDFSGELDFWGKHRAALKSAEAQQKFAAAEAQSARLMVTTSVVRAWGELDRLVQQRKLLAQQIALRQSALDLQRLREKAGFEPGVERAQSEAAIASLRTELRTLEERSLAQRHLLATLAGMEPAAGESLPDPAMRALPAGLPSNVPAELLARRPDVAASRWRVEAATQDAAVTKAAFYPNVNIAGFVGFQSLGLDNWLEYSSRGYSIGPVISLPIFDAGRLRATYGMKTADIDAAVAQYNQSLLDGLREIVDSLTQLQGFDAQVTEQTTARDKTLEAAIILSQREKRGLINHLPVINAELQRLVNERALIDLDARRFDARVQLVRAIGGDGAAALKELLPAQTAQGVDKQTAAKEHS